MDIKTLVFQLTEESPVGMSVKEILEIQPTLSRRSLQRLITNLVNDNKIRAEGEGRSRRYYAVIQAKEEQDQFPSSVPLSEESKSILAYINQPLEARKPVGYHTEFLESYVPNKTFYLSGSIRRQLSQMGETNEKNMPVGTYGREILSRLLIDLSWASSHLEGNTYSRLDTVNLIENGQAAEGKAAIETQMILNHKSAIELLVENADSIGFDRYTLLNLHSALSENLLPNPSDEGRVRQHTVEIGKSTFKPLSVPARIDELFDLLLSKANQIEDPFEQSFFVMVHLPYLQPFSDVNKRTSRLAANLPLIRANLCPLTFLDVSEQAYSRATLGVYELNRIDLLRDLFVWAYERSTQAYLAIKKDLVEPDPLRLAYRNVIKAVISGVVKLNPEDPVEYIELECAKQVQDSSKQEAVTSLVFEELKRLHEGNLARYGLRLSEYQRWKSVN